MSQGKHKGARVLLTLDKEAYEQWKAYAAALDMPTATLLREVLEVARGPIGDVASAAEGVRNGDLNLEELIGRMVLNMMQGQRD